MIKATSSTPIPATKGKSYRSRLLRAAHARLREFGVVHKMPEGMASKLLAGDVVIYQSYPDNNGGRIILVRKDIFSIAP